MKKTDALAYFDDSPVRLAAVLGIRSQAVSQWGDEVPRLRALELERITNGALRADDKPDRSENSAAAFA